MSPSLERMRLAAMFGDGFDVGGLVAGAFAVLGDDGVDIGLGRGETGSRRLVSALVRRS